MFLSQSFVFQPGFAHISHITDFNNAQVLIGKTQRREIKVKVKCAESLFVRLHCFAINDRVFLGYKNLVK